MEEADKGPLTLKAEVTVEEPTEIYPPPRLAKPHTLKVEEALKGPDTWRVPLIVEEAEEINPDNKDRVPLALNLETSVNKPFCRIEKVRAP